MRRTILLVLAVSLEVNGPTVAQPPTSVPLPPPRLLPGGPITTAPLFPTLGPQPAPTLAKPVPTPAPAQAPAEALTTFEPQSVRLAWSGRRWQLQADGKVLKDFGYHEAEARQALRLIQELHLTQRGTVGGSTSMMEYWLADGRAPQGLAGGLRLLPLAQTGLRVEQVQGQWCLRDPQRILFNFGDRVDNARQALDVVQKYGFNQVGVLGVGTPSMMVFLARPGATPLSAGHSSRHMSIPHIPRLPRQAGPNDKAAHAFASAPPSPFAGLVSPAVPLLSPAPDRVTPGDHPGWRQPPHFGAAATPAAAPTTEGAERVPFDWRQAQLRQEGGNWKLSASGHVLADFGANLTDAHMALSAVRYYRFTEQWRVGGGNFTYYTANNVAPRGLMMGVRVQQFQPSALAVQQVGGNYALCAGDQVVARLGDRPDDARRLLEVIRRNQFDQVCQLGEGGSGMTFLVRSR